MLTAIYAAWLFQHCKKAWWFFIVPINNSLTEWPTLKNIIFNRLINEHSLTPGLFCDPGLSYDHNIYGSDTYLLDNKVVVGGGNTYLVQWSQRRSGAWFYPTPGGKKSDLRASEMSLKLTNLTVYWDQDEAQKCLEAQEVHLLELRCGWHSPPQNCGLFFYRFCFCFNHALIKGAYVNSSLLEYKQCGSCEQSQRCVLSWPSAVR